MDYQQGFPALEEIERKQLQMGKGVYSVTTRRRSPALPRLKVPHHIEVPNRRKKRAWRQHSRLRNPDRPRPEFALHTQNMADRRNPTSTGTSDVAIVAYRVVLWYYCNRDYFISFSPLYNQTL